MRTKIQRFKIIGFMIALLASTTVWSDTLELADGNVLNGSYKGGTESTINFELAGTVQQIPTSSVRKLTFTGANAAQSTSVTRKPETPQSMIIPAGTAIQFRFTQGVNSKVAAGLQFSGVLETALLVDGKPTIPAGSAVYGMITESKKGGRLVRQAELGLTLTHIVINEKRYAIDTGLFQAKGERQGTAAKVGAGAAIGAIAGGRKGARIGTAVGAGLAVLSPGKQVNIPAGTILEFQLAMPLTVN